MTKTFFMIHLIVIVCLLSACRQPYQPDNLLSKSEIDTLLVDISVYIDNKPDNISFDDRFKPENRRYYANKVQVQENKLLFLHKKDDVYYFCCQKKDLRSLYEHYLLVGGTFTKTPNGIENVDLKFYSPRLEPEKVEKVATLLFDEMVKTQNIKKYWNEKEMVEFPNKNFYFDVNAKRWLQTDSSEWKFLEEMKQGK